MDTNSYTCHYCETSWPVLQRYQECPRCLEPTYNSFAAPMTRKEAEDESKQAEFGWSLLNSWLSESVLE